jgi:NAD(P)-dependent dehydrogenase (short-subunit alcohol dehydrogenase family)
MTTFRDVLDDLLEILVVPSFTRYGIAIRRRIFRWQEPPPGALAGRTVAITGPTSGLGRAATERLASLGARIILIGRSEDRLVGVRDALVATHGVDRFPIVVADMASLASVRIATERILATEERLDVLIDNAGGIFPERRTSADGIEATFATMVVGPFALIAGLVPLLRRTSAARVISVTSGGMYTQRLDLDDLQGEELPFSGPKAYARAKRAQVGLVREWAHRLSGTWVTINAMHPGWADTPGLAETLPAFYTAMRPALRTASEGADTIIWLASAPDVADVSGRLFLDRRPRPFDRIPTTRLSAADRRRLWDQVARLASTADPAPDSRRSSATTAPD